MDDDKDRDEHTGPGEAVEQEMPEPEEMPGGTLGRGDGEDAAKDADKPRREGDSNR